MDTPTHTPPDTSFPSFPFVVPTYFFGTEETTDDITGADILAKAKASLGKHGVVDMLDELSEGIEDDDLTAETASIMVYPNLREATITLKVSWSEGE